MRNDRPTEVADAMDDLVRGYTEEAYLYARVRNLTWKQRITLRERGGLNRFADLLDEKRDLLRMVAEIETRLCAAKTLVLSRKPSACLNRLKLEALLDGLVGTIQDIRALEAANASLLRAAAGPRAESILDLADARA